MKLLFSTLLFCLSLWVSDYSKAKPYILSSIKPLALIAQDLLGDLAQVEVLLPANADPHHYSLSIRDRQRLNQADIILWSGPALEPFLQKPLSGLKPTRMLAINNFRNPMKLGDHNNNEHLWLSPETMLEVSKALASQASRLEPTLESEVSERLAQRIAAFEKLDEQLAQKLGAFRQQGFIADHPAYDVLVAEFGLKQVGVVQLHEEIGPSARHLTELSNTVAEQKPSCLLVRRGREENQSVKRWSERWQLPLVSIDILAMDERIETYEQLMASVAEAMARCLKQ